MNTSNTQTPIVQARPSRRAGRALVAAAATLAASLAMVLAAPSSAGAKSLACNIKLLVKNGKARAIKVTRFAYKDAGGKDYNEGLANKKLSPGEEEHWDNQRLENVAEGNQVAAIRVEYEDDTSGEGGWPGSPWGKAKWSTWVSQSGDCKDDRAYTFEVR